MGGTRDRSLTIGLGSASLQPSIGPDMRQLWERFPPRGPARTWPATEQQSEPVLAQMLAASFDIDEGRADTAKASAGDGPTAGLVVRPAR